MDASPYTLRDHRRRRRFGRRFRTRICRAIDGIRLHQFLEEPRLGYRPAEAGTKAARGRVIVWTDVDMTYPNDTIPELVKELDGYDQVVGARTHRGGHQRLLRVPAKWLIRRSRAT